MPIRFTAGSRWLLSAEAPVRSQDSPREIYGRESDTGTGLLPILWFSPVSSIPPMFHAHHNLHVAFTNRKNGRSLGTFQKTNALLDIGEN